MRHGRTTPSKRFTGYKLHAAAAVEAPLLTAISVAAANEHDGHQAGALVDQQPERRRPGRLIGDTAYGHVEARELLEQRSVSMLAPVHSSSPKEGTIPKEAFAIDLETDTVTCPQGKTAPIYKPRPNRKRPIRRSAIGERVAKFSRSDCEPCPLRQRSLAERAAGYPNQAPRGPPPSRASGVVRSRRARPSRAHQAANRAAARTHRPPLPRAQEPLPRGPKISVPGRLDRRPRQPPPNRGRAAGPGGIARADPRSHPRRRSPGQRKSGPRNPLFFQGPPTEAGATSGSIQRRRAPAFRAERS
jgi:hypothetical protein